MEQIPTVSASDRFASLAVIPVINPNSSQTSISRNGLSAIFKMRLRHWKDGSPVTVFVLGDENPLHKLFCKQILNVFPHQMRRSWNKLVFSGTGQAPIQVNNQEEMIQKISTTPGAVGYLNPQDLTDDISILEIE
ncbi:MAG: substrate-binding domain-containing protein [Gammaproteobacteria bacterium]